MDFGIFNLMGYRDRGTPTPKILDEAVEQVRLADQVGFEVAWFAEHHFSNYCICPSPLMMVARCAGETRSIKLGTAVVVIPLYQPARLIAEIGMTAALTGGRLVLGVGSGYQPFEFERFGADLAVAKEQTEEFLDMLHLAFTHDSFSYHGQHYQLPETHIAPRPPGGLPEIWIAGDNPAIHRLAARRGLVPMFTGRVSGADYLVAMRTKVEEGWRAEGKDPATMPLGIQRFLCVTDSRAESLAYVDHARHQMRLAASLRRRAELFDGTMLVEQPLPDEATIEQMTDDLLVGDCTTIAERLVDEIRRARPSHVMFFCQVGGASQRQALNTIERFATDIRPAVEKELGPLDRLNVPAIQDAA